MEKVDSSLAKWELIKKEGLGEETIGKRIDKLMSNMIYLDGIRSRENCPGKLEKIVKDMLSKCS